MGSYLLRKLIMKRTISDLLYEKSFICGRMIGATKQPPKGCVCVWNANIVTKSEGKVWFGDLNLTREGDKLKEIAKEFGEPLYVLREHDCRFGTENDSIDMLIERATWSTNQ